MAEKSVGLPDGVRRLLVEMIDSAGVARARIVPYDRVASALAHGISASSSAAALFTADDVAVSAAGMDAVIGDLRLCPDAERVVMIDPDTGLGWAPADVRLMDGTPFAGCARTTLRRVADARAAEGRALRVGFEFEFSLSRPDPNGEMLPAHTGPAYGLAPLLEAADFVTAALDGLETAGVPALQFHAEHGLGQFEVSLMEREPVAAADDYVLTRLIVDRAARSVGLRAHAEPSPPVGEAANGMHLHVSAGGDDDIFAPRPGTDLPDARGLAAIGALLELLPEMLVLLGGSDESFRRLQPHRWSGAFACWGPDNREAAIRYVPRTADAGSAGANIEIKSCDASSNPYLAVAAVAAALEEGIGSAAVPEPVGSDPGALTDEERAARGIRRLPTRLDDALALLDSSAVLRRALGDTVVDLAVAVRSRRS